MSEGVAGAGPWYVYECIPLLKNLAGFEEGSKKNSILTQFIRHMNQNAVSLCLRLVQTSAANRLIGEVVQSRRRPLQGPSPG